MNGRVVFGISMLAVLLGGCATYTTPGGPASLAALERAERSVGGTTVPGGAASPDDPIGAALSRAPRAQFPAQVVAVRIQAAGYVSASSNGYGRGLFSVVTSRDVETEADFARLAAMPGVAGVAALNRLLLPGNLELANVRSAAAELHGDVVLLYTLDTSFHTESGNFGPMQVVSLGFLKKHNAVVSTTCAAALLDVRTGYVYGLAESSATEEQRANSWSTHDAIDAARLRAERAAFTQALGEVEKVWSEVYARYAR
jgi:hypothetical protein